MVQMDNDALEAGRLLAHPPPGEEVVITGAAGAFPDSDSLKEFADKLYNKIDLISGDGRRWILDHPEIPQRTGKLNNISKFDAGYFGIHYKQAHAMDPMCRMVLEKAAEAVFDAGYNPRDLYGAKIGVFVGACFSETEKTWFYERLQVNGFGVTGCARAMLANRISYWLGVKGPSYTVDTACSSSLYAFEHGYRSIREGLCDAAIIAGTNLCLHPYVSLQFARLGVLSKDGKCKCFDEAANGYCRSEAISAVFLQKKKDSRRIYATVVHAKTNCDGYKEQGITFPSGPLQQSLLEEFYDECQIKPCDLAWLEAHGTGTKVGDPEEIKAIEHVFCADRKTPLKIGSLKSNTGHSEPASGLLSISKVLIAMETGFIPPNINYSNPRKDIEALHNGKIEVVTEKTPWEGGLVGVNSFGFGGANCHVLLKWNEKSKVNGGLPKDDLPRLVTISGRTHDAIDFILLNMENNTLDGELVKLYHSIYKNEVPGHLYRGYTIMSKSGNLVREIKECPTLKQPFWYFFPALGVEWENELQGLMKIPMFSQVVIKCSNILKKHNIDLLSLLNGKTPDGKNQTFRTILMNCIVQMSFVTVLKNLAFEADGIIGMSYGEIVCAYADGSLTLEQAVVTSFHVATALSQLENQKASTALIGLPYTQVKTICPSEVACVHQGANSTIVSGPDAQVKSLINKVKEVHSVQSKVLLPVALHGSHVSSVKSALHQQLRKVLPDGKRSSPRWISTSTKDKNSATCFSVSADYFCNNLISPINFDQRFDMIGYNSLIVEVSPNHTSGLFLSKQMKKKMSFVQMLNDKVKNVVASFLSSLGKLGIYGANLDLALIYPTVEFPVSRSTQMISPLIKWNHENDWYVTSYKTQDRITTGERFITVSLKDEEQEYISGHVIDGRNLFPATGYLFLVWESIALMNAKLYSEVAVVFENIRFNRATNMPKEGTVDFTVTIQRSSGYFEILESGAAIVTGKVFVPEDINTETSGIEHDSTLTPEDDMFVLKTKDIYKELRLRGYNYKGNFRSIFCSNLDGTKGFLKWHNNWVTFMDNMLQIQILNTDSRALFVPTSIQRVIIDVKKHLEIVSNLDENNNGLPLYHYKYAKLICSGGIEIRGLNASAISKRKPLGDPVLEKCEYLPYHIKNEGLDFDSILRIFIHIALENNPVISVKVYEMGELGQDFDKYLAHSVIKSLADLPLLQPDIIIFNPQQDKLGEDNPPEISAEDKKMPTDQTALLVVGCELLDPANNETLEACFSSVKENGFVITRDKVHRDVTSNTIMKCSSGVHDGTYFSLLRKVKPAFKKITAVSIDDESFSWLKPLQEALKNDEFKKVIIYSQNKPLNGIMGFVNCIIKEGYTEKARCYFILDKQAPAFSLEDPFYSKQIEYDLAINVYKNGNWGSYRHLQLDSYVDVDLPHAYVAFQTKGDLSSLMWSQGHLATPMLQDKNTKTIQVYYSALNFRDVMTATGKLANEVVEKNRLYQDCVQGLEFSGRDPNGKRIMGMVGCKGIANVVDPNEALYWDVPDDWTLEEAATVPCVYATIVYSFSLVGKPKKGDTILIHAGSGGIGQAAIHYALFHGCKVFTTVGTPEKREFIKTTFPELTDNQIGNSRDTTFEQLVMRETDGRGVDFVINSLAEEKLIASIRCLARGGRFLELGKFDMANDTHIGMEFLLREASFHGVMLNVCFYTDDKWKNMLWSLVHDALKKGAVRPFNRTIFERDEAENAIRFMAAGKHMGKVLIKIRDEEPDLNHKPEPLLIKGKPRFYCDENKSYIILGGLGGFGLELTDWLILRKAKKIVLSSRVGVKEGYQANRIQIWESYGVKISIFTGDIATEEGIVSLLKTANELGPVGGIFNLAVVLKDAIFDNQTEELFTISTKPKAVATSLLDRFSRKMCPQLEHFVIFSSVSCGRGNAGQTNYGMSNSIMERICEQRVEDGYPGLAIQWGAVSDVGLLAILQEEHSDIAIGGTLPQKIESCLAVMDMFLNEKHPVVSSMVVAEKKAGSGGSGNIVDTVVNIIGLRDLKSVSLHSTLAELGMDSMMAVEIKQTLEREFEVFLTPQDIRGMTFAKLQDIAAAKSQPTDSSATGGERSSEPTVEGLQMMIRTVGDESTASTPVIKLSSLDNSSEEISSDYDNRVIFLPGIEGFASVFQNLCTQLKYETICVQYDYTAKHDAIEEIAQSVFERVKKYIKKDFLVRLVGYSFGGIVSLELTRILEELGFKVSLCILDGSPDLMRHVVKLNLDVTSDEAFQIGVLLGFIDLLWPQDKTKLEGPLREQKDWESRMDVVLSATQNNLNYSEGYKRAFMTCIYKRLLATGLYKGVVDHSLKAPLTLLRPYTNILMEYEEDYGLSKYFKKDAQVHVVEGNHLTILDNLKTAEIINDAFACEPTRAN